MVACEDVLEKGRLSSSLKRSVIVSVVRTSKGTYQETGQKSDGKRFLGQDDGVRSLGSLAPRVFAFLFGSSGHFEGAQLRVMKPY